MFNVAAAFLPTEMSTESSSAIDCLLLLLDKKSLSSVTAFLIATRRLNAGFSGLLTSIRKHTTPPMAATCVDWKEGGTEGMAWAKFIGRR